MKNKLKIIFFATSIFILLCHFNLVAKTSDSSVVKENGQLSVNGTQIVNENGDPVVLRGMSLFWSQWMGQYYNSSCINWLSKDWKCTVVRAAMGIEHGGYLSNPTSELNKIKNVIDACIDEGIYVIVDWHDHNAQNHLQESIEFFKEIATLYKDYPNIIYEIYNEPLQISWSNIVKPYAEAVIEEIRAIDSNNIILVGSPTWSQDVDIAANDPLNYENIAYTLHFYAATHKQSLRNKAQTAISKGVALFVSEFGTCEASGSGVLDSVETDRWMNFMEENNIGWCNWSIADKVETASAIKPGSSGLGGWSESQLTPSGKIIRNYLLNSNIPTDIEFDKENGSHNIKFQNSIKNYPNPFNSTTMVQFTLSEASLIKIDLYNTVGEHIKNLFNENFSNGTHFYNVDFSDLPTGNYILSFLTNSEQQYLKMQYIK